MVEKRFGYIIMITIIPEFKVLEVDIPIKEFNAMYILHKLLAQSL